MDIDRRRLIAVSALSAAPVATLAGPAAAAPLMTLGPSSAKAPAPTLKNGADPEKLAFA